MSLNEADIVLVRDVVVGAIETLVLPRFDEHDRRFETLEKDMAEVKEDVRVLKADVSVLKDDMREVKSTLHSLDGRVESLEADIKELYRMHKKAGSLPPHSKAFAKLSLEQKVLRAYEEVLLLAKEAGVTLPH